MIGLSLSLSLGASGVTPSILRSMGWLTGKYPISITGSGVGGFTTDFDRTDYLPDSHFTTTYYVDVATGSDANDGLTTSTKLARIHSAITKGNATGSPYRVEITSGTYPRAYGISNSGTVFPTQDCALIATGGDVTTGVFDDLSWPGTPDATYTNCYKVARSSVARVFDIANSGTHGDYVELTKVADAATCDSTAGSWAQVGSDLYVHRSDASAVTNANTRAYLITTNFKLNASSGSIYCNGINLEGGCVAQGGARIENLSDEVVIFDNCDFKYAGYSGSALDGASVSNASGLFVFKGCRASSNWKDGFNVHWSTDSSRSTFVLTIDCIGIDNGRGSSVSNNGITGHETVVWIDVNGQHSYAYGNPVAFVDDSRLLCAGTYAGFDQDDGSTQLAGYRAANTVLMWLIDCESEMANAADLSYLSRETAIIYYRNFTNTVGTLDTTNVIETSLPI